MVWNRMIPFRVTMTSCFSVKFVYTCFIECVVCGGEGGVCVCVCGGGGGCWCVCVCVSECVFVLVCVLVCMNGVRDCMCGVHVYFSHEVNHH